MLAPIVLFCYNRPKHTEQTLIALSNNSLANQSQLIVFCDGPKDDASDEQRSKIESVRTIIKSKQWCKEVIVYEREVNRGLANSVIEGVTEIVNKYGKVIVLEDDLITSKGFLQYMNEALDRYGAYEEVMQVSGHCFPADGISRKNSSFFIPLSTSWGWATWKRAWDKFDINAADYKDLNVDESLRHKFDLNNSYPYSNMLIHQMEIKNIDSWAIRWWWSVFKHNALVLFPDKSLVNNIGFDADGTHTTSHNPFPIYDFDIHYQIKKFPNQISSMDSYYSIITNYLKNPTLQANKGKSNSFLGKILYKISSIKKRISIF